MEARQSHLAATSIGTSSLSSGIVDVLNVVGLQLWLANFIDRSNVGNAR